MRQKLIAGLSLSDSMSDKEDTDKRHSKFVRGKTKEMKLTLLAKSKKWMNYDSTTETDSPSGAISSTRSHHCRRKKILKRKKKKTSDLTVLTPDTETETDSLAKSFQIMNQIHDSKNPKPVIPQLQFPAATSSKSSQSPSHKNLGRFKKKRKRVESDWHNFCEN